MNIGIRKKFSGLLTASAVVLGTITGIMSPFCTQTVHAESPRITICNNGTLLINGEGRLTRAIVNEAVNGTIISKDEVRKIDFGKGSNITELDDQVFYGFSSLEELVIPETVTSIGRAAFANNTNLKKVTSYVKDVSASNISVYNGHIVEIYTTREIETATWDFPHGIYYIDYTTTFDVDSERNIKSVTRDRVDLKNSEWFRGDTAIEVINMNQNKVMAEQLSSVYTNKIAKEDKKAPYWDQKVYYYNGQTAYVRTRDGDVYYTKQNAAKDNPVKLNIMGNGELLKSDGTGLWHDYFPKADVRGEVLGNMESDEESVDTTTDVSSDGAATADGGSKDGNKNTGSSQNNDQSNKPSSSDQQNTSSNKNNATQTTDTSNKTGGQNNSAASGNSAAPSNVNENINNNAVQPSKTSVNSGNTNSPGGSAGNTGNVTKTSSDQVNSSTKNEEKKTEEKKTEDKKTEDKKTEEKKTEEKKTEDKKTEDKKTEDKKTEEKKTEEKKTEETGKAESPLLTTETNTEKKSKKTVSLSKPKFSVEKTEKKLLINIKKNKGAVKYKIQKYTKKGYVTIKTVKKTGKIGIKTSKLGKKSKTYKLRIVAVNGKIKKVSKVCKIKL